MKFFKTVMLASCLTLALGVTANLSSANTKAGDTAPKSVKAKAEFEGNCAMGVCNDHYVKGDPKVKLQRDGKTYYFSSAEAKDEFEKDYDSNVKKANENWRGFKARGGAHAQ